MNVTVLGLDDRPVAVLAIVSVTFKVATAPLSSGTKTVPV
jgi:hypothetical protein